MSEAGRPAHAAARAQAAEAVCRAAVRVSADEVRDVETGDAPLAIPLFRAARAAGRNPVALADELAPRLDLSGTLLARVTSLRGYLNFTLDRAAYARLALREFAAAPEAYGRSLEGAGRTIVIDYSSPNIAKPFSVGHLRSTIIGQALKEILTWLGYTVIGDNHLGDWGTQFGKLLCAFELWGDEAELEKDPTGHLLKLYVRFHDTAKADPGLDTGARDWFRRLETGDSTARALWLRFVKLSRAEFDRIYGLLGVRFDETLGESCYRDRLKGVTARALALGAARREKPEGPARAGDDEVVAEGETVVLIPLDSKGIDVPLILEKSDGTSLYATREIATAEYRIERWHPERMLYVVGNEQEFYFKQLNAALALLGRSVPCVHVNFGLIRLPEGRMSTREGRVVLLDDVIEEAIKRARRVIADRDLTEKEKDRTARVVGIGAIKYADLSQTRTKEVVFDWDRMLSFEGDSAPYLQYAHTRCRSILRKAGQTETPTADGSRLTASEFPASDISHLTSSISHLTSSDFSLLLRLSRFSQAVQAAAETYEPHRVANYLYRLSQDFSAFYSAAPVLQAETPELKAARLYLVNMTATVLRLGLALLGIGVPDRM